MQCGLSKESCQVYDLCTDRSHKQLACLMLGWVDLVNFIVIWVTNHSKSFLLLCASKGVKPCSKLTRRPWQQEKWVLRHSEQGHYQLYGEDKIFELRWQFNEASYHHSSVLSPGQKFVAVRATPLWPACLKVVEREIGGTACGLGLGTFQ